MVSFAGMNCPSGAKTGSWPRGLRVSIVTFVVSVTAIYTGIRTGVVLEYSVAGCRVVWLGLTPGSTGIGYPWYSGTILAARITSMGVPFTSAIERFQSAGTPYP